MTATLRSDTVYRYDNEKSATDTRAGCAGWLLGLCAASLQPTGCLLPDYCIVLNVVGNDYCTVADESMMWPIGSPELATPVLEDGGAVVGCECLNATEAQWIEDEVPEPQFLALVAEIENATRDECASLVPPGFDHNCYANEIEFGPIFVNDGPTKSGSCIDSCAYLNPPPFGSCSDDPNPFECNEDDDGSGTTGSEQETGTDTTDGATTGLIEPEARL